MYLNEWITCAVLMTQTIRHIYNSMIKQAKLNQVYIPKTAGLITNIYLHTGTVNRIMPVIYSINFNLWHSLSLPPPIESNNCTAHTQTITFTRKKRTAATNCNAIQPNQNKSLRFKWEKTVELIIKIGGILLICIKH